jgi:peptidoglycan-associated lipoprotein
MNKVIFYKAIALLLIFTACNSGRKNFKVGKNKYDQAEYQLAIERFKEALNKGGISAKERTEANYMIAESFRRSNRIQEAEPFYNRALSGKIEDEAADFYYAYALKATGNYEGAKSHLESYIGRATNFDYKNRAEKEVENLKVLGEIATKKSYYKVENVEKLNTPSAEYSPFFQNKTKKLYFTSAREAEKIHNATGTGFTDIYEYVFDGVEKFSGQAKKMPEVINTPNAHESSSVFSKDGKTMIFSRGNDGSKKGRQNVDLFSTTLGKDGNWSEPEMLSVSDPNAWDSSPALSKDGKTLYFASDREHAEAKGGSDIYKATRNTKGDWGNVKNMGSPVNTHGNDAYPYEADNGDLYFSSDGHPSFGSYDLFVLRKGEDGAVKVENLGKPLNSSADDFALAFKDSIVGYFCSNRPGGKGDDDVYEFTDHSKIRIAHYILDGTSFGIDMSKQEYVLDSVEVKVVNQKGDTIATLLSKNGGKFSTELEPEQVYTLVPHKSGYFKSKDDKVKFSLVGKKVPFNKLEPGDTEFKFEAKTLIKKIEINVIITIDNIYYDFNKSDIRADAAVQLDSMVTFLASNPEIMVELGSHSDSRGSADYNRKLAQKRAEAAVNYIISHGIESSRIAAKGYGEDVPLYKEKDIMKLKTKEEQEVLHQKNRRTEFKITGIKEGGNKKIIIKKKEDN